MAKYISGSNARSEDGSGYSGSNGRVKSSAGVIVLPKEKSSTVKKGRASSKSAKKKRTRAAAVKTAIKNRIRKDTRVRYLFIAIMVAAAALISFGIIIYSGKVSFYSEHYYEGTVINGIDVSDMTLAEASDAMQNMVNDYGITVTDFEGRNYFGSAPVFGLTYQDDGTLSGILGSQMPLLWPFKKGEDNSFDIASSLSVDRNLVKTWISSLDCSGEAVLPKDACLATDADGYYYIENEVYGNTVDVEGMSDILENSVKTGALFLNMTDPETYCYLKPSVYSTDSRLHEEMAAKNEEVFAQKELAKKINELTNVSILLPGQNQDYTLDPQSLKAWIGYDSKGEPYLYTDAVYDWVNSYAAENGLTGSANLFRTHDGYIVTVDQGTYPGWAMDVNATADLVKNALETRTSGTIYPVLLSADGVAQSQDAYVEISLSDQMMWYFENGNVLLETPIVSGNVLADLETPSYGVWVIDGKYTQYLMRAPLNEDGTRDYETTVNYWMPFNDDVGIHDLSNREEFGGDIYVRDGSHGCINTPLDKVSQLYDLVHQGTKVVVYGS